LDAKGIELLYLRFVVAQKEKQSKTREQCFLAASFSEKEILGIRLVHVSLVRANCRENALLIFIALRPL